MQENLKNNEFKESLVSMIDFIPDPVVVVNSLGNIVAANKMIENYVDFKRDDLVGQNFLTGSFLFEEDRVLLAENLKRRLDGCRVPLYEIRLKPKRNDAKHIKLVEVKGSKIKFAGKSLDLVIFHDVTERSNRENEMQQDLFESETRFKAVSDSVFDAVVLFDDEDRIVYWNEAAERIYGFNKSEVLGKTVNETIIPLSLRRSHDEFIKRFAESELNDVNKVFESQQLKKDGTEFSAEISLSLVRLNQPSKSRILAAVVRDITERKESQQKLSQNEERLRLTLEAVNEGIWEWHIPSGKAVLSPSYYTMLGYQPFEFPQNYKFGFKSLIHPDDVVKTEKTIKNAIARKKGYSIEFRMHTKTGGWRWILSRGKIVQWNDQDRPLRMVGTHTDITERKNFETKLSKSEEKYRMIFEENLDARLITDAETGIILECNQATLRMVGKEKSEIVGQHQSSMHPEELKKSGFTKGFKEHIQDSSEAFETQVITKKGETKDVSIIASVFELNGRKVVQGTFRDITQLKMTQRTLIENEGKFHGIANSVRDAIILIDEHTRVTYWNPAAEKTFGYKTEEALGKHVHELVVPLSMSKQGRAYIREGIKNFIQTGTGNFTNGNIELIGRRKDRKEFPAKVSISPIKLNGKWNAVGVVKDITERKHAEQALREAEQRYHALFDHAPIGILIVDPETASFVEFNNFACSQLGYSREELARLTLPEIEAQETSNDVKAHIAQILSEGGTQFETRHRAKDGEIKSVLVSVKTIELEGKTLLQCIFHDITEIRRVQDALMESETRYRQLVELAQEGVWVLDKEFNTTFVNRRMAQMMGYAESEMIGKNLFEFIDTKDAALARRALEKYANGVQGDFEYEFPRKDGSRIYTSIAASQMKDDRGHPVGTLALVSDITLRKQMEHKLEEYSKHLEVLVEQRTKQLKEMQAQLVKSEKLAAIGELAGMVGHDLRNPLTGIKNATYFLEKKGSTISETQHKDLFATINRCIDHSNKIINDLLEYSRDIHLELKQTSIRKIVSDALHIVNLPEKVKVEYRLPEDETITIDENKIVRVLINLTKNASDAMPQGGKITIECQKTHDTLKISVSDTGSGISEDILPKLFSPLFTTKAQGMGFGLAICKRFVEAHNGTITVETCKNQGTKFKVILPIIQMKSGGDNIWINVPESLLLTTTKK